MNSRNPLLGKVVTAVYIADDKKSIRFDVEGGDPIVVKTDGDCCSDSWIEEVQGVEQLVGSPVVNVESVPMRDDQRDGCDVVAFYGCKITTGKGYALIDYRTSSNGYYGGNLAWPGDYFYGGVYGQNVSKERWKRIDEA